MAKEINEQNIKKRIRTIEEHKSFEIHFAIPEEYEDTYDMLLEDIGNGDNLILDDVIEERKDGKLVGYAIIEFDGDYNYETLLNRASQFDMLSNGIDLIEEC